MSFVIYNTATLKRMPSPHSGQMLFPSERVAKTIRTKVLKGSNTSAEEVALWKVAPIDEWVAADKDIVVKSAMDGRDVTIKASNRGCRASDPSLEGYWTM